LQILVLDVNKELRWRDYRGPVMSQFFRGSHWWILEALPNGHTRLLHGAELFGLALPFIRPTMNATRRGYHLWNKALRQEVLASVQQQQQQAQQQQQGQQQVAAVARVARVGKGGQKHVEHLTLEDLAARI
jgi:hypothetical protein